MYYFCILLITAAIQCQSLLYPRSSETREVVSLDGIWKFAVDNRNGTRNSLVFHEDGLNNNKNLDVILMPVPSSYNDIVEDADIRDHVGVVWYEREFFVPKLWSGQRVWIRFSSVMYSAEVWINGFLVTAHQIGHLPFEVDISKVLKYGIENRVTVACDNTLLQTTIPQGEVHEIDTDQGKKLIQTYSFDFFNYAGIQRSVMLFTTPMNHIDDISVITNILKNGTAIIKYQIQSHSSNTSIGVKLYDQSENFIASNCTENGVMIIPNPNLWWPYLMHPNFGYLYTLEVQLLNNLGDIIDVYRLKIGIRELHWSNSTFTINGKRIYMHGFGKHEDADIRGKGLDLPTVIKDFNLIKWIGGNAFRTSHYPYAEEIMDLADAFGIMVIDECPAVNTQNFSKDLQLTHMDSLRELIKRDKNRPSVIAWSIANEPSSNLDGAGEYFKVISEHTKSLDKTRPITASLNALYSDDHLAQFLDIISFNRYNAWYDNSGRLDMIIKNILTEAQNWRSFNKPILISEYGAETMTGLHIVPDYVWSEEYQVSLMSGHFKAFDMLRSNSWFVGEFIWNFADFKTAQTITRVGGNRKGVFTRSRQPKAAAYHLRRRYFSLAKELYNATQPNDLNQYIAPNGQNADRVDL